VQHSIFQSFHQLGMWARGGGELTRPTRTTPVPGSDPPCPVPRPCLSLNGDDGVCNTTKYTSKE